MDNESGNPNDSAVKLAENNLKHERLMRNQLKLAKTEESFILLRDHIPFYNPERSIAVLARKLRNREECEKYTKKLDDMMETAKMDFEKIQILYTTYNSKYSSDNPKCLETPHFIYNAVHHVMQDMRDNINKFSPRAKRGSNERLTKEQIINRSLLLGNQPYTSDMFPELFPDYMKDLHQKLTNYIELSEEIINLCTYLMEEEKSIRENEEECHQLFLEEKEELEKELAWLIGHVDPKAEDLKNYERTFQGPKPYGRGLHNLSVKDLKICILCGIYHAASTNGLTDEETKVWPNRSSDDFVKDKVRKVLRNMKDCKELPMTKMRNSEERALRAEFLACLTVWCRANAKGQTRHFLNYLRSTFQNTNLHLPKDSAVYEKLRCGKNECYNWKEYMEIIENLSI